VFDRPHYQEDVVNSYISNKGCVDGILKEMIPVGSKRGYPDVSIFGHDYAVVSKGKLGRMDGTSASAPAFAAFISRYNNERISRGKRSLGFLNPLLYQAFRNDSKSFNRVRYGNIRCLEKMCCEVGYAVCDGNWSPSSGTSMYNKKKIPHLISLYLILNIERTREPKL
jgi:hypothetical protein